MAILDDKTAVVTGAGRGIGREIALKLASAGAAVVVNDLDADPAVETVEAITSAGGRAVAVSGSITEPGMPDHLVKTAEAEFGGLHVIVNNAGFTWDAVVQKMSDEQWDAVLDVHLKAPFRLLRAAQPLISKAVKAERERGERVIRKVVNISSLAGVGGSAGQSNYAAAKAGVEGLTRSLAKEWGRYDVTVNAVAFGLISTRLTQSTDEGATIAVGERELKVGLNAEMLRRMEESIPLGRAGTAEEAAGAVYLFCQPESNYVTGQTLLCSGGFMV